jgi:flagellar biosynthesis/type III secretory pathway protein FliH
MLFLFNFFRKTETPKIAKRAYKKGYIEGRQDGEQLGYRRGKEDGLNQGWKEAMSKIGDITDRLIIRNKEK